MKKLLLMLAFVPGMGYCVHAQESPRTAIALEIPDSLSLLYRQIDLMGPSDLKKNREAFLYKCRKEPSDHNRAALAYIEDRMNRLNLPLR